MTLQRAEVFRYIVLALALTVKPTIMRKYLYWSSIIGMPLASLSIVLGAWVFVSSTDKSAARPFFIFGIVMLICSILWFVMLRRKMPN